MLNDDDELMLRRELDHANEVIEVTEDALDAAHDHLRQREEQLARRDRLIRYFAIPYTYQDGNGDTVETNPEFVTFDPYTNTRLTGNIELKRTWWRVVRGIDLDEDGEAVSSTDANASEEEEGVGPADAPQQGE